MTVQDFLKHATAILEQAGIASARLDTLILLEDALGRDRGYILAHPEAKISPSTEVELNTKIAQRSQHTPLAYIRGEAEFYGREFTVNEHVLVPRPETETMIDLLKKLDTFPRDDNATIIDVGTGSGAIAITAKLDCPGAKLIATDIDEQTLKVARQNAKKLKAEVEFLHGDLLGPVFRMPSSIGNSVILANLPYVPERYAINRAAEYEPKHAIFSGKDGLNLYRRLWKEIPDLPEPPLFVLTEALPPQHSDITNLAGSAGFALHSSQDFIQVFKRI